MAASTGRGGAGNIGPEEQAKATSESLATPTIKQDIYTTGRGGSGNMAKHDPTKPEATRAAQDVEGPISTPVTRGAVMHHGRGGAANVINKPKDHSGKEEDEKEKEKSAKSKAEALNADSARKPRRPSSGLLEKAKEGFDRVKRGSSGTRKGEPEK